MRIDFDLLDKMVASGATARMIVDVLRARHADHKVSDTAAAFVQFRAAYPRRDGANPWRPAEQRFNTLVRSGVDPCRIIAAAMKFAQEEAARGNIGTRFVPMAMTWLNQHRFDDVQKSGYLDGRNFTPTPGMWEQIVDTYKRLGYWSRYAGPDPTSPACRCPRELLVKHGIVTVAA